MKTIYLDNDALINIVEKQDSHIKEKVQNLLTSGQYNFVFSLWNLFEIAKSFPEQAIALAKFVDEIEKKFWTRGNCILFPTFNAKLFLKWESQQ